jgi:class 3 adenylate cyclase/tetratricopeptide (TPR) repeat protein
MEGPSQICPNCGTPNPGNARFCLACGTRLEAAAEPNETRRMVTIVFVDLAGSTALGELLDPEAVRALMGRYFDTARAVVERHGGIVEKFIGDAVMAVFGLPTLHEDDPLRAVRAASELEPALAVAGLADRIKIRTGVNTGVVVAGNADLGQRLVTGDAVNVAARLEQHAEPGTVLLGEETYRLVRDAVVVDEVGPIVAKGKAEPLRAYRLRSVDPEAEMTRRRLDGPLVGRSREIGRLHRAFDDVVQDQRCGLFTLLGSAGVGKSRLVHEFLAEVSARATILRGRCLPYGEGITYWPVAEILRVAAGIGEEDDSATALAKLRRRVADEDDGPEIADRLATAIGLVEGEADRDDVFRAFRRFIESVARSRPVVLVFDDLHWAEPTLLDLIEHVSDWSRGSSILVLAVARPEFVESRPGWAGGKLDAQTVLLEPLDTDATGELARALLGADIDVILVARIEEVAEGNPLFVEQLVAMLVEEGLVEREGGRWRPTRELSMVAVPPTISALLAARLDRLPEDERHLAERASVVGRVFERLAVAELSPEPERPLVTQHLRNLVRRELIRPDASSRAVEDTFRFRHILIRDAAYDALPKRERADLHARFAAWLESTMTGRLAEFEEILAYHLDQAVRYRADLGLDDDTTASLRGTAAEHFARAGHRAIEHGDPYAGSRLLTRATELQRVGPGPSVEALLELAVAHLELNDGPAGNAASMEALEVAERIDDAVAIQRARVLQAISRTATDPSFSMTAFDATIDEALRVLEPTHQALALAEAWAARGYAALTRSDWTTAGAAYERVRTYALEAGSTSMSELAATWLGNVLIWGPIRSDEGLARIDDLLTTMRTRRGSAFIQIYRGIFLGYQNRIEEAYREVDAGRAALVELGGRGRQLSNLGYAEIPRAVGDIDRTVELLEEGRANLERLGETGTRSTVEAVLAMCYARLGRPDDAFAIADAAERDATADDVASQTMLRAGRALALVRVGRPEEAISTAAAAVEIVAESDQLNAHAEALEAQAEVLRLAGHEAEAQAALKAAIGYYARKGNLAALARLGANTSGYYAESVGL